MPILNYSTKIDASKTVGEIQSILSKKGVRKIVIDFDSDSNPVALTFSITISGNPAFFSLPCNYEGVQKALQKEGIRVNTAQALRVAWRIIKDWVQAQMAIIEAQLAKLEEVFLPYAITKNGTTLFKEIESGNNTLLLTQS